jgi:hypothetical protein
MTVYVDADHAYGIVTRISITEILVILNNTPIRLISKRQKILETSTNDLEFVASRIVTELILEVRYMLRSLVVALDGPALKLGDNMSVVLNTTDSSKGLKKSCSTVVYHQVIEAISAGIMRFSCIKSE